jgi:glucose/arabinose dehydrogenase
VSTTTPRQHGPAAWRVSLLVTLAVTAAMALESAAVAARDPSPASAEPAGGPSVGLVRVLNGYDRPVALATAAPGDDRLFIVEQTGRIRIATRVGGGWQKSGTFLDISSGVVCCGEQGLLGLAFSPNYARNGRFYVNYTRRSDGATVVAEYRRSSRNRADRNSKRKVLTISQPFENHNGGTMIFGPDRRLYIATGDGGGAGDPANRAQRLDTLLGKLLRIDPRDPDGRGPRRYRVPRDNPYVGRAGFDEIWSRGLRNPWKFSFDRRTDDLWLADVGQSRYEEVNHRATGRGANFGWRLLEGAHNYQRSPSGALCRSNCMALPIVEYAQDFPGADDNCSVTGGYVYRGSRYRSLVGDYIFGDFCSGRIWRIPSTFDRGDRLPAATNTSLNISSFGEDARGELYLVDLGGAIYRVTP